jgi:hypothetical protein
MSIFVFRPRLSSILSGFPSGSVIACVPYCPPHPSGLLQLQQPPHHPRRRLFASVRIQHVLSEMYHHITLLLPTLIPFILGLFISLFIGFPSIPGLATTTKIHKLREGQ